jgi:hypothetical protein
VMLILELVGPLIIIVKLTEWTERGLIRLQIDNMGW